MAHRIAFEALDVTLKDILDVDLPFGGKILIVGGDFRQFMPVVPHSTRGQTIEACIVKSKLWETVKMIRLKQNMPARYDPLYSTFLLSIGDGLEPNVQNDMIKIPNDMVIPWANEALVNVLVNTIFPNLSENAANKEYIAGRALSTTLNEYVDTLNEELIQTFAGEEVVYYSFDKVEDGTQNFFQQEFLNSIFPGGLPPHKLTLKLGTPIMLLRNLNPKNGLCNGTRLICQRFLRNLIDVEIVTGNFSGNRVFLPRIPLRPSENIKLGFQFTRKQFPVRLSFALTINKAQGQTIQNVGICLPEHVFSHGQLYVALSRGVSMNSTKVMVKNGTLQGLTGTYRRNVVYKEVRFPCMQF